MSFCASSNNPSFDQVTNGANGTLLIPNDLNWIKFDHSLKEYRKRNGSGAVYDDPRIAVGPVF